MPNLIRKTLEADIQTVDEQEGIVKAILSSGMPDRQGEMIDQKSWKLDEYRKNPVILWSHDPFQPAIAQMTEIGINSDGMLEGVMKFAVKEYDFARTIFNLYAGKFIRAFSVGFTSDTQDEINDIKVLKDNTLYEVSAVNVPADALALAKQKGIDISPIEKFEKEYHEKPYPNEHSCRINNPNKYDRFARKNCEIKHDGKCIDVIYGIKDNKSEIQAFRYDKEVWTAEAARSHCESHDGSFEAASKEEGKGDPCKECAEKAVDKINDFLTKEGRMLSTKNRAIIEKARDALGEVLKADEDSRANKNTKRKTINYNKVLNKAVRELLKVKKENEVIS